MYVKRSLGGQDMAGVISFQLSFHEWDQLDGSQHHKHIKLKDKVDYG